MHVISLSQWETWGIVFSSHFKRLKRNMKGYCCWLCHFPMIQHKNIWFLWTRSVLVIEVCIFLLEVIVSPYNGILTSTLRCQSLGPFCSLWLLFTVPPQSSVSVSVCWCLAFMVLCCWEYSQDNLNFVTAYSCHIWLFISPSLFSNF